MTTNENGPKHSYLYVFFCFLCLNLTNPTKALKVNSPPTLNSLPALKPCAKPALIRSGLTWPFPLDIGQTWKAFCIFCTSSEVFPSLIPPKCAASFSLLEVLLLPQHDRFSILPPSLLLQRTPSFLHLWHLLQVAVPSSQRARALRIMSQGCPSQRQRRTSRETDILATPRLPWSPGSWWALPVSAQDTRPNLSPQASPYLWPHCMPPKPCCHPSKVFPQDVTLLTMAISRFPDSLRP